MAERKAPALPRITLTQEARNYGPGNIWLRDFIQRHSTEQDTFEGVLQALRYRGLDNIQPLRSVWDGTRWSGWHFANNDSDGVYPSFARPPEEWIKEMLRRIGKEPAYDMLYREADLQRLIDDPDPPPDVQTLTLTTRRVFTAAQPAAAPLQHPPHSAISAKGGQAKQEQRWGKQIALAEQLAAQLWEAHPEWKFQPVIDEILRAISAEGLDLPNFDTVRKWLKRAGKADRIYIPANASKGGAPRNT